MKSMNMVVVKGNTFPVKDQLRELGGKWNPEEKAWYVPAAKEDAAKALVAGAVDAPATGGERKPFIHYKCRVCGVRASRYVRIYRSGECRDCYEDRWGG